MSNLYDLSNAGQWAPGLRMLPNGGTEPTPPPWTRPRLRGIRRMNAEQVADAVNALIDDEAVRVLAVGEILPVTEGDSGGNVWSVFLCTVLLQERQPAPDPHAEEFPDRERELALIAAHDAFLRDFPDDAPSF
jgi:hypothetical protein